MYDTILVPTDGSDLADRALEHAIAAAKQADATVHLLYVVDMRVAQSAPGLAIDEIRQTLGDEGEKVTNALERTVADADLDVVTTVREGVPDDEILAYADEADADLIVMGTHGKSQRERILVGSVTDRVNHAAEIPVLTVPGKDQS
ncbi:universal stress protein [Halorientalis brevis]|uniref:Universal stress protein n=1 Tax=Halorientalis brevis TaxID=1126241 RepID=A0ABD6CGA9_9EURY|nr:universal stress protein [Halorientalis brevis]